MKKFVALICLFFTAFVFAQTNTLENSIKGVYLFKFSSFIEWPSSAFPSANTPFIIGILGDDPFGSNLEQIVRGKTVRGRPIIVKRFKLVQQVKGVHILYISQSETERLNQIVGSLRGTSILTVSDKSTGTIGIINFIVQENKVRFEIDASAADRAGLKVSSKLLSVAKVR